MTIREQYESVLKQTTYGVIAVGSVVFIAFIWRYPHAPRRQSGLLGLLLGVVLAPVLVMLGRVLYRCPRCHADFQKLRVEQLGRWHPDRRMYWQLWDACPQCHVSFDEPWDGAIR